MSTRLITTPNGLTLESLTSKLRSGNFPVKPLERLGSLCDRKIVVHTDLVKHDQEVKELVDDINTHITISYICV